MHADGEGRRLGDQESRRQVGIISRKIRLKRDENGRHTAPLEVGED
jgi:hypothetical protein